MLNAVAWNTNWAWGLPLIALNVVIHVFGLGIFTEKVEHILSRLKSRRRFTSIFAIVMSVTVVIATILHGVEGAVWAGAYRLLDA